VIAARIFSTDKLRCLEEDEEEGVLRWIMLKKKEQWVGQE
jgi:hypothetical protein